MIAPVLPLLLVVGITNAYTFDQGFRGVSYSYGGGYLIPWDSNAVISQDQYPCTRTGYFSDPQSCRRFYQCARTRSFTRFLYECPEGEVFAETQQECVRGTCPSDADAVFPDSDGAERNEEGAPTDTGAEAESSSGSDASDSTAQEGETGAVAEDTADTAGTTAEDSSSSGSLPPSVDPDTSIVTLDPKPTECTKRYVQHEVFCNLFYECGQPVEVYHLCAIGTAFDQNRQMCRLSSSDEALCGPDKKVFEVSDPSLVREAFRWDQVGVITTAQTGILNTNPFSFTNLGAWRAESGEPRPMEYETLLRFNALARGNTHSITPTPQKVTVKQPIKTDDIFKYKNQFDAMVKDQFHMEEEKEEEKDLFGTQFDSPKQDFELKQPQSFGISPAFTFQSQTYNPFSSSVGSKYLPPGFLAGYSSPFVVSGSSYSPFSNQGQFKNPFLRQSALGYTSPQSVAVPISVYPFSQYTGYSPFSSNQFSSVPLNTYRQSPLLNYFTNPFKSSFTPVSIPATYATQSNIPISFSTTGEIQNHKQATVPSKPQGFHYGDNNDLVDFIKKSEKFTSGDKKLYETFYDSSNPEGPKYTVIFDPLSVRREDDLQARNEGEVVYNIIPLSNLDMVSLVEESIKSPNFDLLPAIL